MKTELQARTLWCPMVRHEGEGGTFNRGWATGNPLNLAEASRAQSFLCNCIASRCASWRWENPVNTQLHPCEDGNATREPPRPSAMPDDWVFTASLPGSNSAYWAAPFDKRSWRGYCGLSGKPATS